MFTADIVLKSKHGTSCLRTRKITVWTGNNIDTNRIASSNGILKNCQSTYSHNLQLTSVLTWVEIDLEFGSLFDPQKQQNKVMWSLFA